MCFVFYTGRKGRPKVVIEEEQIRALLKENYTAPQMASHFQCSVRTVHNRLQSLGIQLKHKFTPLSDAELEEAVGVVH